MIFYIMGVKREEGRRGGRGRGGVCCVGGVGAVWWRVAKRCPLHRGGGAVLG